MLLLVMWVLRKKKFTNFFCYVDNFYFFLPAGYRVARFVGRLIEVFKMMNVPLHA